MNKATTQDITTENTQIISLIRVKWRRRRRKIGDHNNNNNKKILYTKAS